MTNDPDPWEALARYLAGESSPEEQVRIREWLAGDPAQGDLLRALDRALARTAFVSPPDLDVERALRAVAARRDAMAIERPRPRWHVQPWLAAAAAVLVLTSALLWLSSRRGGAVLALATRVGQRDSIVLSDSTRVLLGPQSRLALARGYGKRNRDVELHGVARFDVRHDATLPFRVHAGSAWISDLGTSFTVHSDSGLPVRVLVTSGSVRLGRGTAQEGVRLDAGDRGVLYPDGRIGSERDTATESELAWTQGRLVFDNAAIELVRVEIFRWYGIALEIADSTLARRHLTAAFDAGEPAPQVLNVIALALGATLERRGNDTVVVHSIAGSGAGPHR